MQSRRAGNMLAAFSFVLWGILPLYYQFLPQANTNELLALRIIFSVPVMLLVMLLLKRPLPTISTLLADKKSLFMCFIAGCIMSVSWYAFTWAITHGEVLAASLGYFINPLFAIALGLFFLSERLSKAQVAAVALAIIGIGYQVWQYGELPWLSLIMGSFFAIYGLTKKYIKYDALTSVTIEAAVLTPFAVIYMFWLYLSGDSVSLTSGATTFLLYVGSAPVTVAPLIFFALALNRTSLTMVGLMQYIEPSLQFLLAVFLFGEVFDQTKAVSFGLIWFGLILCTLEALPSLFHRKKKIALPH
ncbi:EamA family transporter RarD [Photobacterium leiognathi]|uniref:EamA family transporter RarD n=1 Tax=Photobacterium leiognathi subsp. mandapamensis TaxID=48408 RepID=A0A2T3KSG5_PHOLD|nr:EamA family transporter RarD [Photobacterium leiognathi]PSV09397.1 EamA family transporter RarD [Photobacterium leiognathi subsp. mandapamensis]